MSEAGLIDDFHLILRLHSKLSDLRTHIIDLAGFAMHFVFDQLDRMASVFMY
jgi:hypothetical protein